MAGTEKDQKATPYRLSQARNEGRVARSPELVTIAVLVGACAVLGARGRAILLEEFGAGASALTLAGRVASNADSFLTLVRITVCHALVVLAPLFACLVVIAVVATLLHTGVAFSLHPLKWDFARLHPMRGFKRIVSIRGVYNAARVSVKLAVYGCILGYTCTHYMAAFANLDLLSPREYLNQLFVALGTLSGRLIAAMLIFAVIDLGYTKFQFARDMRMSRQDIKDDVKRRDGDPRIRARIRKHRLESYKRIMAAQHVKKADFMIVNPTHIAVAFSYDRSTGEEPRLVAKGSGSLARKMREVAAAAGIPIVENRPLARALFKRLDISQPIPIDLFSDVARIVVWVIARQRGTTLSSQG